MSATATLPTAEGRPLGNGPSPGEGRRAAIRAAVLAGLGRPCQLYGVAVAPLWGDCYRVNVMTGTDPTCVRIAHSYFVVADERGNILQSNPALRREY